MSEGREIKLPHFFPQSLESVYSWSRILHNLRMLRRNTWLSPSELERIQTKKLRRIIKYAYENTAFYHKRFNDSKVKPDDIKSVENLRKIPILTKSDVQRNPESLNAKDIKMEKCVKEETSGSTGIPLTIFAEKRMSCVLKANELRHYVENGGSLLRDKFVLLGLRRLPDKRTHLGSLLKRLGIFRSIRMCIQDPIEDVFDKLVDFRPDVIKAYPSFLVLLAQEMEKRGKSVHPKYIWTNGELVDVRSRKLIDSAFGTEMFDGYGCTEAGYVAWECSEHAGYHVNVDFVVAEFLKDGEHVTAGENGEIVLTPLWNYAMPLIRYRVNDIGTPSSERCPCGRGLPLIEVIDGRLDDFIALPSGRVISPLITLSYFEEVEGIAEYRIVQQRKDRLTVQITLKERHRDNTVSQLEERFREGLGENIEIEIEIVDAIATGPKLRRVVSKRLSREHFIS